jgi:hypothetical protein
MSKIAICILISLFSLTNRINAQEAYPENVKVTITLNEGFCGYCLNELNNWIDKSGLRQKDVCWNLNARSTENALILKEQIQNGFEIKINEVIIIPELAFSGSIEIKIIRDQGECKKISFKVNQINKAERRFLRQLKKGILKEME